MPETYKVALGPVIEHKLEHGDPTWPRFNASFVNQDLPLGDIANALRAGCPITTWHKNRWRHSQNYICGQHLGLDFDAGDDTSTVPRLAQDSFIGRYGAILYTTPSHTPEKPKARAVFLLDTPIQQAQNYVLAARALLWLFGTADRQCKDACRFFYGGRPGVCELEQIGETLPLDELKALIAKYKATGEREHKRLSQAYTYDTVDKAKVVHALKRIDPWALEYDQWLSVLMAIHAELGDVGMDIAETWADGRPGEVEQKWRGFHADGGVGIGTLFALAKQFQPPPSRSYPFRAIEA